MPVWNALDTLKVWFPPDRREAPPADIERETNYALSYASYAIALGVREDTAVEDSRKALRFIAHANIRPSESVAFSTGEVLSHVVLHAKESLGIDALKAAARVSPTHAIQIAGALLDESSSWPLHKRHSLIRAIQWSFALLNDDEAAALVRTLVVTYPSMDAERRRSPDKRPDPLLQSVRLPGSKECADVLIQLFTRLPERRVFICELVEQIDTKTLNAESRGALASMLSFAQNEEDARLRDASARALVHLGRSSSGADTATIVR
jgi:hypothetical protein